MYLEIVIFSTEIMMMKVTLWCFFQGEKGLLKKSPIQLFKTKLKYGMEFFQKRWKCNKDMYDTDT